MNARENPEIHLFPGVFADIKRACGKDMVHLFSQYIYNPSIGWNTSYPVN